MSKYKITRISHKKTIIAQSYDEMTNIKDTQESSSINPYASMALDPERLVKGTGGMGFVEGRESINPDYGMYSSNEPGEGKPIEFANNAKMMQMLNKDPNKLEKDTNRMREFLEKTQGLSTRQVVPKLESLYKIYLGSQDGLALDKLKSEARLIKQISPQDLAYLQQQPFWNLIKDQLS